MHHKKCLICKDGKKNDCLYWHVDEKTGIPWVWCSGVCQRGYSLTQYCSIAGIEVDDFIKDGIDVAQEQDNEVNALAWPANFIPLSDPRAQKGIDYIKSRGLTADGDMYYDLDENGIVFPYYFHNQFCGAQVRFIDERVKDDGSKWKITTLPGTRLGLLVYGFNQTKFLPQIKTVVVTEGAFNAMALQQAFNHAYGGVSHCPWKFLALSGSGVSSHQAEVLKELKDGGYQVIAAPDTDEAGFKMLQKLKESECITHYAMSGDTEKDWNDIGKSMENKDFARWFLKQIQKVN